MLTSNLNSHHWKALAVCGVHYPSPPESFEFSLHILFGGWLSVVRSSGYHTVSSGAPKRPLELVVYQENEGHSLITVALCLITHIRPLLCFCPCNFIFRDSALEFFGAAFSLVLRTDCLYIISLSNNKSGNHPKIQMKQPFSLPGLNCYLKMRNWKSAPKIHLLMSWSQKLIFSLPLLESLFLCGVNKFNFFLLKHITIQRSICRARRKWYSACPRFNPNVAHINQ